jgi:hypothetical protein
MVIHLKSLKHTEFLTLSDSDTELSTDIHLLFLDFIKTTNTLREYQKRLFFFDLQTRKTWPSDIAFLDLEHRYPFSPNSEKVFKPDIPFPAIGHEDLIESFTFYINYNTQIDGTTLFQDAFREILRTTFASDSDLQRETLMTWFHDTAQLAHIGPIFAAHTPQFISALDQLHYPVEIQDTGSNIYVGQTPLRNSTYFWNSLLTLRTTTNPIQPPDIHIVNLEEAAKRKKSTDTSNSDTTAEYDDTDYYYWAPQKNSLWTDGDFTLTTTAVNKNLLDKEIKTYTIDIQKSETTRTTAKLTHIACWPDGAIPTEEHDHTIAKTIMGLAKELGTENKLLYIHCKAGLGRTGVFRIALTYAMRTIAGKFRIPPGVLLENYRENTRYAVQTPNQFDYLRVLCKHIDAIHSEDTGESVP